MNLAEIREMPVIELEVKSRELRQHLFSLYLEKSINKNRYDKPHRIRQLRKDIAQVETELTAKRKAAAQPAAVPAAAE